MEDRSGDAMQALVESFTLVGIEAVRVEVQISIDPGYPRVTMVGLPDKAVRESLERILAAFHSAGQQVPQERIIVNLAPAELRKEGAAFDLAIALGILEAGKRLPSRCLKGVPVAGELALSGKVRPVRGALAMALAASRLGRRTLALPEDNQGEAGGVAGVRVHPLRSLGETIVWLREASAAGVDLARDPGGGETGRAPQPARTGDGDEPGSARGSKTSLDLSQVRGQAATKRALEVTAAGGHNLLMMGPPGTGKTLLAQRLPGILPSLDPEESLEVTLIHSVAGLLPAGTSRLRLRPFRAPHHTVSGPGLVGGGAVPRPGEVSLAHCGVLFLDEMPEFRPPVLNLMREPLEEGCVRIVRSGRTVTFPSRFMLVGAMNPCPCGFLGHPRRPCRCTPHQIKLYRGRLSGPLLDRIDLHIEVPAVTSRELTRGMERASPGRRRAASGPDPPARGETSSSVRLRVQAARTVQSLRFRGRAGLHCNAQMGIPEIEEFCRIEEATRAFLQKAVESLSLSARAAHRALRVARTIADLRGADGIELEHLAEAVQYQAFDRSME